MGSIGQDDFILAPKRAVTVGRPTKLTIEDISPCFFPTLLNDDHEAQVEEYTTPVNIEFIHSGWIRLLDAGISKEKVFEAAWVLTLRSYVGSEEICFGLRTSRKEKICHHVVDVDYTVGELLQSQQRSTIAVERGSKSITPLCNTFVQFIGDFETVTKHKNSVSFVVSSSLSRRRTGVPSMFLQYSSTLLSQEMASNIAATLSKIIHQILERTSSPLRQLDILSDNDREHICGWNSRSPEPTTPFLHELVAERAAMHPDTPAIFSWDGELTYGELDSMANRFAHYLVSLGVGPEVPVIICFPKTLWTVVTMLAILKSGGTFVPLDPAAPVQRQNSIIKALGATLAVMDPTLATQFDGRIQRVITDLPALIKSLPSLRRKPCASITESTAAYVMFSSGSTGEPKGITIHHGAATASIPALGRELGLTPNDRVLQFAAWTFDVCLGDVFPPLVIGASVCIPSDEERVSDLSGAINRLRVTYATLTPTIAGLLTPDKVPGLKTLVLGGEAATQDNYSTWTRHVNLYNAFGPTETVVWNLATGIIKPSGSPANVGSGMNAIFWIVDPQNNDLLVPIGSVGELVIEGPVVGRGYLNDPVKTAAAFIEHPPWSRKLQINVPYNARAYRTGDLARYNADGTAQFMGRKDAQVKLHGQRMDLAGIEHQIKLQLSKGSQVVVDLVKRKSSKVLGAFICLPNQVKASGIRDETLVPMNDELHSLINNLASELQKILPKYMVPGLFLIPKQMPTTPSLKTDRKRLLAAANNLDDKTFSSYTVQERRNHGPTSTPTGNVSLRLRSLWAEALAMSPDSISGNDSLFELGGDSLTAMKLVSRAREEGLCFSVTDVFKHPLLDDLAAVATAMDAPVSSKVAPYSLLIENAASGSIKAKAVLDCRAGVMDIYPCTSLQESFMATTIKDPGAYVNRYVFSLPPSINLDRFKNAWALVVDNLPILRTRIIQADCGTLYQIVTDDKISWKSTIEVARYLEEDLRIPTGLGDSLSRYAIVQNKLGQPVKFIWTVHHSLYDGWCFDTLLDLVSTAYEKGSVPQTIEFNRFMRYIQDIDLTASDKYWKDRLLGANQPTFPAPLKTFQTPANESTGIAFPLATQSRANITLATILRAAWAMIVARYSDSDDVVFGVTSIGRNADVPGIDMIVGPTITSIPVRVKLSRDQTIASFLADVQAEAIDSIPFEQVPMRKIKSASADAALSCEFQNLLVIQSDDMETSNNSLGMKVIETAEEMLHPYSLVLECSMTSKGINLRTQHDTNVISTAQIERLLYQFKHVVQQLDAYAVDQTIRSVNLMSPEDHSQLSKWNKVLPASANVCAHHLIQDQVLLQPNAPAISAWDASFTYKELDNASSKLARHLISIGVGPEVLVALCFEKSAWAVVAMLAVMKSGGAFVPLDPSHPMSRKQEIVGQANAKIILASLGHSAQDWGALKVVTVDSSWISKVNDQFLFEVDIDVSPDNILYVLFTSGSSGQPKGFIIEHAAFISSALSQGKATFMSSESRIFQFSSYSFDVSILEIVTGLIFGGCICIASADATKDITKAIDDMQVTWACVTPSVMRLVQPDKVPTLQTLVLGGEAVSTSDVAAWSEKVNLVLGYGPSEVSVAATTTDPLTLTSDPDNFGTPGASLCWVVDANDYHTLAPLGTTGEIMIEGPILARGYLNDPVKTAAAFITDIPQWLKNAAALRPASWIPSKKPLRLYRTGDLGKMNPDGSINFVSRKDRQVKVRGQRVELSEVEHHLSTFPEMRHFVVEFPKQGPFMKKLVVVMSLHEISICSDGESQLRIASGNVKERATTSAENICNALAEIVPSYMVPTVRIVVEDMPYTPSGKINRVRVKNWLNTLDDKTYRQVIDHDEEMSVEEPANDLEQSLRRIWATSLQMDEGQVSLNKSFFQLAGDSILAMRVMALARDDGINVGVQDILRCRNIPELALRIDPEVKRRARTEVKKVVTFAVDTSSKVDSQHESDFSSDADFWDLPNLPFRSNKPVRYVFSLSDDLASKLLQGSSKTTPIEPSDLILTALVHSFNSMFPERHAPSVVDLHDGTTLWNSAATTDDLLEALRQVKESRSTLNPNQSSTIDRPELALDTKQLQERSRGRPKSIYQATHTSLMSLVAHSQGHSLRISFMHIKGMKHGDRMLPWMRRFQLSLRDLIRELSVKQGRRASSDFRLASPTAAKLDDLIKVKLPSIGKGFEDVEDMYPCSALQQGILISQLQNAGAGLYEDWAVFEVVPQRPGSKVSASQLEKAWQAVVARHGILRAILAQDITKYGVFGQLVLSNYHADTSIVRCNNYDEWRASRTTALDYSKFQPPHRLTICTIPDGRVFCEIETNHAINDGESSSIMIRDFALAYDDLLPKTPAPRYSSFISFIQQQSAPSEVYWKSYLAGLSPCHFPTLVDTTEASRELLVSQIKTTVPISSLMQFCRSNGTSLSALFQLIWALVLRTYTGSDDVCFGFINSGRDTPIDGIQDVVGPLLSVLTSRVAFAKEDTASQILNKLQSDFFDSLPYQHFGMSEIQRTLGIPGEALFNSGMSFRKSATEQPKESISFKPVDEVGRTEYDVTIVVDVTEEGVDLFLCHWTSRLSAGHATNVIGTFDALLSTVIQNPTRKIGDLKLLSHRDMKQIAKWNTEEPELVQECIHTAFEQQVDIRPRAPAVCSWDGQLTYRGLDILAGKLAQHLRSRGVGPEVIVPLCFEKSVYVLISMVAVLKAGGVIAVLDPANPVARLHEIAFQVQAKLVLTSSANTDKFASVVELTLTVDQEFLDMLPPCRKPVETPVTPDNAAYIISTSGSSGKPKIVVIPHAAFCSGAKGQAIASNIGPDSRILQFASYSFDVSIMETFTSLMYGACVCMPSENSRSTQIVELINEMKITWAFLTPSVIKTISPAEIPDLKTLILGGEALHQSNLEIWSEKLHLLNGYECSVAATANTATTCYTSPANIGRAIGGRCWIVDSQDHNELVPVGVIGELLIQGPILARGYLGDIEKTAAAFISKPTWSKDVKYNRYYKTGDLCRYSSSGDIMFVGRKDTQVKVRGQRLELGEVEHNLSLCPQISHAAVFAPKQGPFKGQLIAALSLSDLESSVNNSYGVLELVSGDEKMIASSQIAEATESMNKTLPNYMIPTSWAVLKKIPLLPSGKLDRTALRVWLDNLDSATHRQILELEQDTDDTTLSQTEKKIQAIWSTVLNTPAETIGSRTNFFSIGGNSITAMQVVARCRLEGVTVGIQDILRLKTVAQLAAFVDAAGGFAVDMEPMAPELEVIPPFSLFPVDYKSEDSLYPSIDDVAAMCHISADQIEDMFPCGPWQDECMAMTAKQPKIYIARNVFSLPTTLDIERFKSVWERLAAKHPVLRTRIIPCDASKPLQVIVKEKITWNRGTSLEKYMKKDEQISMTYGGRLLRYGLIDQGTDERLFVLTSHHAIYDRWTIKTILTEVDQMYKDKSTVEPVPFQRFIKYVETRDLDKSAAYWEEQLGGNTPTTFPSLPFPSYQPHPNEQLQLKVAFKRAPQSNTLISNLLRAAWAITLAEATKSDDVVFIASINSRGIPVRDIDDIVGPTLTVEPIRVKINPSQSVPAYLDSIQTQAMDMIPFEQTGLTEMRRLGLSDKHLFLVQPLPGEDDMCEILGEPVGTGFLKDFDPFALVMECSVADEGVFLEARYDGVVFSYEQMQSVLERFATVMTFIAKEDESKRLRDIYQHEVAEVEKQVKRDSQLILNGTLGKKDLEDTIDLWYLKQPMIQTRSYAESDEEISSLESTSERIALY